MSSQVETNTLPGIRFDDAATYSHPMVQAAFGVTAKTIKRWRKQTHVRRFPVPFLIGNVPYWRGQSLNQWLQRQAEGLK